jgi:hypothetical protein
MFGLVAATPSFSSDRVDAVKAPPRDAKIYTKLYQKAQGNPDVVAGRNVLKHGRAKDGKLSWKVVRSESKRLRRDLRISYLDRNPSQRHNYELAKLLYPDRLWALDAIFGGGDGIGGDFGESDWHHDIWNGGVRGAWPDRHPYVDLSTCRTGWAYGLGQACPRLKMEIWARERGFKNPKRIYSSPKMQIIWAVEGYAPAAHGSIEAAAGQWTAGGRHGRTW